ncbi:MAG: nucleotide exchange factor GrpE [SAR202 cluster bacterium]|nr:nucleotide exchange factor GrpE [SAR202 cluster bacterium]
MQEQQGPDLSGRRDESAQAAESPSVEQQLEEALREKEQFRALAQRAQADLANFKRHIAEEQEGTRKYGTASVLLKVLGAVDDFQRAIGSIPAESVSASWLEGLRLVERNIENVLTSEGVTRIDAKGKPYDPREQEALFFVETDKVAPGHVVDVVRQGYRLHDRILRAAQVSVSRQPEQSQSENNTTEESDRRVEDA